MQWMAAQARGLSFKVGSFVMLVVSDGGHTYTVESLFANVSQQAEAALTPRATERTASTHAPGGECRQPLGAGRHGPGRSSIPRAGSQAT
jgi:hypothetical protein